MNVCINGEQRELPDSTTAASMLEELGLKPGHVVIEINGKIIQRDDTTNTIVPEGAAVEIVHFVGGG